MTKNTESPAKPKRRKFDRSAFGYTVPQLAGDPFGRSKLYDLMASGELPYKTIGRQRIILADSYHKLLGMDG